MNCMETAFDLLCSGPKVDIDYYSNLLMNEYVTFLENLVYETNNANRKHQKHVGEIIFDSQVLDL